MRDSWEGHDARASQEDGRAPDTRAGMAHSPDEARDHGRGQEAMRAPLTRRDVPHIVPPEGRRRPTSRPTNWTGKHDESSIESIDIRDPRAPASKSTAPILPPAPPTILVWVEGSGGQRAWAGSENLVCRRRKSKHEAKGTGMEGGITGRGDKGKCRQWAQETGTLGRGK